MKPEELRIGNYYNQYGNVHKVDWIVIRDLQKAPESQIWCKPIPLTEEILIKCGFRKTEKTFPYSYFKGNENGYKAFRIQHSTIIDLNNIEDQKEGYYAVYLNNKFWFGCFYLHQLQNLYFVLTGQELTYLT